MTLRELFEAVKEQNLTKTQLEDYHSKLTSLFASMHLEMAQLEKEEAKMLSEHEEKSDIAAKRKWNGKTEGQRLIELKHYAKACEKMLSSIKSRIYSQY